ncbi:hydroxyethylthiazole kinase [Oceanospirillaceae bacterium]|jgi:hydroxyethylthiazole kinase|uniref:hydroxyethylthiazole kinase n=1 Tax=Candidatus Njordibacter sp. Uisw_002 TaxID=3230971 RepID=UPI00236D3F7F|nr:hydroxyethylthiazole kinase [Oceanospirillaceae bacterium]MDB9972589.1 hydroxyethylthiazole kinase [Oceanospirillaceae bacterium]MDB9972606.1 hydroxyethylthiazole kinase [Oceanospirillaceae bacterium]MDC1340751.1 hydroxyethylthiazole kinase [Oceanospirillaceae bacterium]MDC1509765.1 hydroxyethylthiazole kinase [Oceanospirillaceae bacterium]|tara:strand:+ start:14038 stop:14853 length:816 start_codon:yes stop_codon:yes gene_type:complete
MPNSLSSNLRQNQLTAFYAKGAIEALTALSKKRSRVHCITSTVAQDISSDVILAIGAGSSFTLGTEEITELVAVTNSLVVNIGTLDNNRKNAIRAALQAANDYSKPWILDPVSVHASKTRCAYAKELLQHRPHVIRANAMEIKALVGSSSPMAAQELALQQGCVVAQTGETDLVTNGVKTIMIANGHAMQTRISAMGCATTAFMACFMAVDHDAFDAAVQALLTMGVSAELAANKSFGPGSMHMNLLDSLYSINEVTLARYGHVLELEASK